MPYIFNFSPASHPDFPLGYPMNLPSKTHLVDEYICLNCWKGKVPGGYREREMVRKLYMVSGRQIQVAMASNQSWIHSPHLCLINSETGKSLLRSTHPPKIKENPAYIHFLGLLASSSPPHLKFLISKCFFCFTQSPLTVHFFLFDDIIEYIFRFKI